ncbi:MAG: DUF302 domain-containing protein [Gammaproteobacteria bacterium]|nr:DUF302 domain-containing protein [Gammaproteobacteria bacterium]
MNKYLLLPILVCSLLLSSQAQASDNYITKKSPYPVAKTLDRLEKILKSKGIAVFTRVDHAAGASRVMIAMKPTQLLIFGNPKLGTPLMNENRMVGLDLPMKALAWEDDEGQVWLSYLKPAELQHRHELNNDAVIKKMTGALEAMTSKAVAAE